jgi:hypothetical protein
VPAHERPLVGVQRGRLAEDRVGDGDLADVVQLGRAGDLVELLAPHAEAARDGDGQLGDGAGVLAQRGLARVQGADEDVARLLADRRRLAVLARVHALVGDAQRRGRVLGLVREQHGPVGGGHGEALPRLGQGAGRAVEDRLDLVLAGRDEGAELVAAEAVGLAVLGDGELELRPEAGQEGVAGEVAEGVVVVLEAVEVEEQEDPRRAVARGLQLDLEVAHELAAVAQAGQRVRERLAAAGGDHPQVLREGHGHAHEERDDGQARERDGERVQRRELIGDDDAGRGEPEDGRHQQDEAAVQARLVEARRPGRGERESEQRRGPDRVEQGALDVRALGEPDEERGVAHRGEGERAADDRPRPPGRQPVRAKSATTKPSRTTSPTGYATVVTTLGRSPAIDSDTAS